MATFPQPYDGVTTQLPFDRRRRWLTSRNDLPEGKRWAYSHRPGPLRGWTVRYEVLTQAELDAIEAFWNSVKGRLGTFAFLDPGGNMVTNSEDFADASWSSTLTIGAAAPDPFGGNRGRAVSGSGSMGTTIAGIDITGYVLCGSIWAKPDAAGSITVSLVQGADFATKTYSLQAGAWRRVLVTGTVPAATNVEFRVALAGGTWTLFGAQTAPSQGPGGYQRTPGNEAVAENCRFDTDLFSVEKPGIDRNRIELRIREFAA